MATLPPELLAAHGLFLNELHGHLTAMQEKLAALDTASLDSIEPVRKALEHRFHIIRGGAGFFQLEQVQQAATTGELALRKGRSIEEYRSFFANEASGLLSIISSAVA